ncbi:MAG: PTS sugar transporter subunit IIB [Enterococcus avium]
MQDLNVLLVCGSGLSSGFMAANIRKAAKKRGLKMKVKARSESEIEGYLSEIDAILVGPHLAYLAEEIKGYERTDNVKILLMSGDYYSSLNGEAALDHLLSILEN